MKIEFDIHGIYVVYARHIPPPYIHMEYTWYIPTIYLVGVPDVVCQCVWHATGITETSQDSN
jgi:hypothetical protein